MYVFGCSSNEDFQDITLDFDFEVRNGDIDIYVYGNDQLHMHRFAENSTFSGC